MALHHFDKALEKINSEERLIMAHGFSLWLVILFSGRQNITAGNLWCSKDVYLMVVRKGKGWWEDAEADWV